MINRINKIRKVMQKKNMEAFIVNNNSNCFYLSGFTGSSCMLLFTPDNNYFITDFRYRDQAKSEIEGYKIIEINNKKLEKIYELLKKENIKKLSFEACEVTFAEYEKYKDKFNTIELIPVKNVIQDLRIIKEENEIEKIKEAVKIADKAFLHIINYIKPGVRERDLALELEFFMKKKGGKKNPFPFIVASGVRSALPHGVAGNKKINKGELLTIDFGTVYENYCSDMTRTIVVGKPTKKQKKIYNLVLKAHMEVINRIRAGMSCKEADALARNIIDNAGYKENFKHGLGHGLGIEVHEQPKVSYKQENILKENMVITDEPGIYISQWGGVRIEDDIVVKKEGCQVLNNTSKELIVI